MRVQLVLSEMPVTSSTSDGFVGDARRASELTAHIDNVSAPRWSPETEKTTSTGGAVDDASY